MNPSGLPQKEALIQRFARQNQDLDKLKACPRFREFLKDFPSLTESWNLNEANALLSMWRELEFLRRRRGLLDLGGED